MTRQQLISHAIAVLQVRQMGGSARFVTPHNTQCLCWTRAMNAGLLKMRKIEQELQFKLTATGLNLSNELIASASEAL